MRLSLSLVGLFIPLGQISDYPSHLTKIVPLALYVVGAKI